MIRIAHCFRLEISSRWLACLVTFCFLAMGRGAAWGAQAAASTVAAGSNVVHIDASAPVEAPETGYLHLGGKSSNGHDLEINSRYITLDGKPWLPVMGEFHYARFPEQYWEDEILKMKASGVNIVATYIFWIHHEEIEGQFDWTGRRDLRHFVELCAKHGMYVYLRVGPWDHGEARNGGFPDWLMKLPKNRVNDPEYLGHVATYFNQIGAQVKGLMWQDGGPIVGAQIENEYGKHGADAGSAHILKLKELAIAAGITVPFYSVTGWPTLDFPPQEVVPVEGGYPDGFWYGPKGNLPPSETFLFNPRRSLGNMGAMVPFTDKSGKVDLKHDPYLDAEQAGGMATAYHRRPLIQPDDITALELVALGSGVNMYGYYMYHGGANPTGKLTTLQESQATSYPNDLPQINYDFQAPLGEYGQVHESYRKTKNLHLFLNAFGPQLAEMVSLGDVRQPKNPADTSVPRVALRAQGDSGFLFVNNYVRQLEMPARKGFQVAVQLPSGLRNVPSKPMEVPANSYFIWPVNLDMGAVRLEYSTAQLLTKVAGPQGEMYVFFAVPGVAPEFSFAAGTVGSVKAAVAGSVSVGTVAGSTVVSKVKPGVDAVLRVIGKDSKEVQVLVVTEAEAEQISVLHLSWGDFLALTPAELFVDEAQLHVRSIDPQGMRLALYPALGVGPGATMRGMWEMVAFDQPKVDVKYTWTRVKEAGQAPPVKPGLMRNKKAGMPLVPDEEAFDAAAVWRLTVPAMAAKGISDVWVNLAYTGDIGRLYVGDTLKDDNFYNGAPWEIGLKRYGSPGTAQSFDVKVLPLRADSPVYIDPEVKANLPKSGQMAEVKITVKPEYESVVTLSPAK